MSFHRLPTLSCELSVFAWIGITYLFRFGVRLLDLARVPTSQTLMWHQNPIEVWDMMGWERDCEGIDHISLGIEFNFPCDLKRKIGMS